MNSFCCSSSLSLSLPRDLKEESALVECSSARSQVAARADSIFELLFALFRALQCNSKFLLSAKHKTIRSSKKETSSEMWVHELRHFQSNAFSFTYHEVESRNEEDREREREKQMICAFHFAMPHQVTIIHRLHLWLKSFLGTNSRNIFRWVTRNSFAFISLSK